LFNSNGKVIFQTETSTSENEDTAAKDTAVIKLVGEMFVTNNANMSTAGAVPYRKKIIGSEDIPYYQSSGTDLIINENSIGTFTYSAANHTLTMKDLVVSVSSAIAYELNRHSDMTTVIHQIDSETTNTYSILSNVTGPTILISPKTNNYVNATRHDFVY
jgi:hypothetical protein